MLHVLFSLVMTGSLSLKPLWSSIIVHCHSHNALGTPLAEPDTHASSPSQMLPLGQRNTH